MTPLMALLFLCCILSLNTVYGQLLASNNKNDTSFCCNSQCRPQVKPTFITLAQVVNRSPYYLQTGINNSLMEGIDNVCATYFPIDNSSFIQFTGLVFSNGSYLVIKFIIAELTPNSGVLRLQGLSKSSGSSTTIFDEVYLGDVCPGVSVFYRNYIAGSCTILDQAIGAQTDYRHGDSTTRDISDDCKRRITALGNSQQFRGSNFVNTPNLLNRHCVTQFNGASCINANRVLPQDSYTLSTTNTGTSCPMYCTS